MLKRARLKCGAAIMSALMVMALGSRTVAVAEPPAPVFSTWEIFEVDKLASIWLIKRFINPEAEIKLYPRGQRIEEGVPFDTPDANLRRYFNRSTYEMFMQQYGIGDARCLYIAKIVHDIEINTWEEKVMPESRTVIAAIQGIITGSSSSDEIIIRAVNYFDALYKKKAQP